jgi:hypothetical protein
VCPYAVYVYCLVASISPHQNLIHDSIHIRPESEGIPLVPVGPHASLFLASSPAADTLSVPGLAGLFLFLRSTATRALRSSGLLLIRFRLGVFFFLLIVLILFLRFLAVSSDVLAFIILLDVIFFLILFLLLILTLAFSTSTLILDIQFADSLDDIIAGTGDVNAWVVFGSVLFDRVAPLGLNCDLAIRLFLCDCSSRCPSSPVP